MNEYLVVQHSEDRRAWRIDGTSGAIPDDFRLQEGVRLARRYPARVILDITQSGGNMKVDFIRNLDRIILASGRARDLLLSKGVLEKDVELLPASLRDKKGRVLEEPYTIVNPVVAVPCMDRKKSVFSTFSNSDEVMDVRRLVLLPDRIPERLVLLRLGEDPKYMLVRADLVKAIEKAGLTGFRAIGLDEDIM
jgi:hypothetical protein